MKLLFDFLFYLNSCSSVVGRVRWDDNQFQNTLILGLRSLCWFDKMGGRFPELLSHIVCYCY